MTQGARGVVVHDHDGSAAYPAQPVPAVDTTGAGDAFAAGFLYQIAEGGTHADAACTCPCQRLATPSRCVDP